MEYQTLKPRQIDLGATMEPLEVAKQLQRLDGFVFFDSAGHFPVKCGNTYSVLAARPVRLLKGDISDLEPLREAANSYRVESEIDGFPLGGLCGWVDYEGQYCFGLYPEMLVYDHQKACWWEVGELSSEIRRDQRGEEHTAQSRSSEVKIGAFRSEMTPETYIANVRKAQEYITAGDIYQVNVTQRYEAEIEGGSLFGLYEYLRESSPAPQAAWLQLGGREILSSSPETFLKIEQDLIETRPIKGTRPRYKEVQDDRAAAEELLASKKEIAELVMITDLERNDLGKICQYGSVAVPQLVQLESFEHVYHLVSTVQGTLRDDVDHWQALASCFPGGSITGAPKKRAMEIIEELESGARGLYTGSVGYVGFNGCSQFSIVIRSLVREGSQLSYSVGAGIVADSDAQAEYEETLHKARGVNLALENFRLGKLG